MKQLIILFVALTINGVAFSQSVKAKEVQLELKGDTLIVPYYPLYKFIKIGDRVYKINAPTLTEVQEAPMLRSSFLTWPYNMIPSGISGKTLIFADSTTISSLYNK